MASLQNSQQLLQPIIQMQNLQQKPMIKKHSKIQDDIKIVIGIWNMEGMIPPHNSIKIFMESVVTNIPHEAPDIICIATQECQRSINMSFFCENKEEWENALKQSANGYKLVESQAMNALHTALLVKEGIADCYSTEKKTKMKAGFCNLLGNKGAISIVVNLLGQNLQFINCHLEAHQNSNLRRNQVLMRIADNLVEKDYRNQVFICGDLNYRIQMTHQQYHTFVGKQYNTEQVMSYIRMFEKQQLTNQQILRQNFFPFYKEDPVSFPPTYKMTQYGPQYDKSRIPGWTDRIFHRKGRVKQLNYKCLYNLYGTDHRPVLASYKVKTEETLNIFPDQFIPIKNNSKGCALI